MQIELELDEIINKHIVLNYKLFLDENLHLIMLSPKKNRYEN